MRVGVFYFPTDYGIDIRELARAAEERGFESLLLPEHTHIPKSRRTPFPGGGELPKAYSHTHDPFVALSFAAAVTTKILLGTGICLIPQRDPIVTAKCVASLDQLSNGRFLFGIGGGWNVDEMENHGARYETRFKLMRERILAMKALWTQEEAAFHGEMVNFDPVWLYPKPAQRPHPPILLGGDQRPYLEARRGILRWLVAHRQTGLQRQRSGRAVTSSGIGGWAGLLDAVDQCVRRRRPTQRFSPNTVSVGIQRALLADSRSNSRRNSGRARQVRTIGSLRVRTDCDPHVQRNGKRFPARFRKC